MQSKKVLRMRRYGDVSGEGHCLFLTPLDRKLIRPQHRLPYGQQIRKYVGCLMKFENIPEEECRNARHPHEFFLINLITNHILVFVGLLGMAKQEPYLILIVPVVSVVILSYLVWRARLSKGRDSWFVFSHWQLCARRSRFFIGMIAFMGLGILAIIASVGGDVSDLRPGHYAIGGIVMLPTLFTILVLIIMESDAVHKATIGEVPDWLVKKVPPPDEYVPLPPLQPVPGD